MKLLLIFAIFGLVQGQLPEFKCNSEEPDITQCVVNLLEVVRPFLKEGIPGIMPGMDPLVIPKTPPLETSLPGFKAKIAASNIVVTGGSDIQVKNFRLDRKVKTAELTVLVPKIEVSAEYTSNIRELFFDVNSTGVFTGTFNEILVKVKAIGEYDNIDDPQHIIISDIRVDISFGRGTTFNLDIKEGGMSARLQTKLANMAPKKLVLLFLKPTINITAGQMIKKILNLILSKIPLQSLP